MVKGRAGLHGLKSGPWGRFPFPKFQFISTFFDRSADSSSSHHAFAMCQVGSSRKWMEEWLWVSLETKRHLLQGCKPSQEALSSVEVTTASWEAIRYLAETNILASPVARLTWQRTSKIMPFVCVLTNVSRRHDCYSIERNILLFQKMWLTNTMTNIWLQSIWPTQLLAVSRPLLLDSVYLHPIWQSWYLGPAPRTSPFGLRWLRDACLLRRLNGTWQALREMKSTWLGSPW